MIRRFVAKVVEYVVDELYASDKFRKMLSEILCQARPAAVHDRDIQVSSVVQVPNVDTDETKVMAEAFGKMVLSGQKPSLSGNISSEGKVVRSEGAGRTLDLLKNIGE